MLKIVDLNVYYGSIHAIKGVSFEVKQGDIVTLIGSNGAGKSTILKSISNLIPTSSGDILFLGESTLKYEAHKLVEKGISHVPEGRRIFPLLSFHSQPVFVLPPSRIIDDCKLESHMV